MVVVVVFHLVNVGSGPTGAEEIKSHPFFNNIDWSRLASKEIEAPFKPSINHETDTSNFSEEFTQMDVTDAPVEAPPNHERLFRGNYTIAAHNSNLVVLIGKLIYCMYIEFIYRFLICGI